MTHVRRENAAMEIIADMQSGRLSAEDAGTELDRIDYIGNAWDLVNNLAYLQAKTKGRP